MAVSQGWGGVRSEADCNVVPRQVLVCGSCPGLVVCIRAQCENFPTLTVDSVCSPEALSKGQRPELAARTPAPVPLLGQRIPLLRAFSGPVAQGSACPRPQASVPPRPRGAFLDTPHPPTHCRLAASQPCPLWPNSGGSPLPPHGTRFRSPGQLSAGLPPPAPTPSPSPCPAGGTHRSRSPRAGTWG